MNTKSLRRLTWQLYGCLWLLATQLACTVGAEHSGSQQSVEQTRVHTIRLSMSNVHLVVPPTGQLVLVDSGGPDEQDREVLGEALGQLGFGFSDLGWIIITHGHADHAGGAAELRRLSGAQIIAGQGDLDMTLSGRNAPLHPQNLMARVLRPFVDVPYPEFTPDRLLAPGDALDATLLGLDGRIQSVPGHTPGSIALQLRSGEVFVGDMVLGGIMGGALFATSPGRHYYHDDATAAEAWLDEFLERDARAFYPGHGGPIPAKAIREWRSDER